MTRLAWLTDVHLNFLHPRAVRIFGAELREQRFDMAVITGDIAEAASLRYCLEELREGLRRPIALVLGNHDYWGSSFEAVHAVARDIASTTWLTETTVTLAPGVALVGHDGFYDARLGDPRGSRVEMDCFKKIEDLRTRSTNTLHLLQEMGRVHAAEARKTLDAALKNNHRVIFATHVPPFKGASWHKRALSNGDWLPWMTNHAIGEMLVSMALEHPYREILVLCGHTHGRGVYQPLRNLRVLTGAAKYGAPAVERIFDVREGGIGGAG